MRFVLRNYPRVCASFLQIVVIVLSLTTAFLLRFDFSVPLSEMGFLYSGLGVAVLVKMLVFFLMDLDKTRNRLMTGRDFYRDLIGNIVASMSFAAVVLLTIEQGFPRSIYFIDFLVSLLLTTGFRFGLSALRDLRAQQEGLTASWAPRILADSLIVLAAFVAGLLTRFGFLLLSQSGTSVESIWVSFEYFFRRGPLLVALLLVTFIITGVYTRKRGYPRRSKFIALAQSISISYGLFLLVCYLTSSADFFLPRSAFLVSYLLTLVGCIAARYLANYVTANFDIQPKSYSAGRKVEKVLVIGGAGYIGSVLVRNLLEAQHEVRVLDLLMFGDESIRPLYDHPSFELIRGDFRHVDAVVNAVKGMDAVIHLGAIVGDPACALDEQNTMQTNYAATALVAEVCKGSGVARLVFASTCSVYGATDHLVDEKSELNPVSLYAATKIDSEKVLLASKDVDFHPTILRLGTAFGLSTRPRFDLVVNLLTAKAYFEKKIAIFNGEQWRPFVHVKDIARAFRLMLEAPLPAISGEVFNVGSYKMNHRLSEISETICQIAPNVSVVHEKNSDIRNYRVSFDKIHSVLGFECQTSLAEGIVEMYGALGKGQVTDYTEKIYHNHKLIEHNGSANLRAVPLELAAGKFSKPQVDDGPRWGEQGVAQHKVRTAAVS